MNTKHILIKYYRINNRLKGVVVALDKNIVGWAMCHPRDIFNKTKGLNIAISRASYLYQKLGSKGIIYYYSKVPKSLELDVDNMRIRSLKYFKDDYS